MSENLWIGRLNGDFTNQFLTNEGFKVKAAAGNEQNKWVKLRETFSCDEFTADTDDVATQEKKPKWKYLDKIANEINQTSVVTDRLLMGANCEKAL